MKSIFITGTDTDVGKTYIASLLAKKLPKDKSCYYKPVLSGATIEDGKTVPGDAKFVIDAANFSHEPMDFVSYAFIKAASPHLAAEHENKKIELEKIVSDFSNLKKNYENIIIEGAGGIVCPMGEELLQEDIIKALGQKVLIVTKSGLGSINASVTTVEYLRNRDIEISAIIMNNFIRGDFIHEDNKKMIEELTGVKVIATVSHGDSEIELEDEFLEKI